MRIAAQAKVALASTLGAIVLIASAVTWAEYAAENATRQRRAANEITLGITQLRMATFELGLMGSQHARTRWAEVSARLDQRIAQSNFPGAAESAIVGDIARSRDAARRMFADLLSEHPASAGEKAPPGVAPMATEKLIRLMAVQQETLDHAYRLASLAEERMATSLSRVTVITLAGLGFIATVVGASFWHFRRRILPAIHHLRRATMEIASGNWTYAPHETRLDEIGDLWRNFDAMVTRLHASLVNIEQGNRQLSEMNRELESFAYSVSHDLRAPLRSLDGFSLVLLEDYGDKLDDEGRDALARIRGASRRMGTLIDDILRLSRVTRVALRRADVDFSARAREVGASLAMEHPERQVHLRIDEGLRVRADGALVDIVLRNLLENAWKFTARKDVAEIHVGARPSGTEAELFVADNGVGFDMAHAGQLFGAFQRLHPVSDFPGTGIGLAIVQRIIRRHGGRISAHGIVGEGATISFTFGENGEPGTG